MITIRDHELRRRGSALTIEIQQSNRSFWILYLDEGEGKKEG